ncbi:hypothetical protein SDC9_123430 [bioreactor metagenome]|uniref:Uncharacterized protein n=1 Tax=bioreactor metagenome TaxID=1076179 RepID=A0A645CHR7_9ZZZZ
MIIVRRIKIIATHVVARASLASKVLALFLDKKVSELPLIDPESPAVLLGCKSITTMRNTLVIAWMIDMPNFKQLHSFQNCCAIWQKVTFYVNQ